MLNLIESTGDFSLLLFAKCTVLSISDLIFHHDHSCFRNWSATNISNQAIMTFVEKCKIKYVITMNTKDENSKYQAIQKGTQDFELSTKYF